MTWKTGLVLLMLVALGVPLAACGERKEADETTIRSAWQLTVAVEGQAIEALKSTDILKKRKLKVDWTPFLAGPPAVDAALANRVDIIIAAAPPTLTLLSQDAGWSVVAHDAELRHGVVVPSNAPYKTVGDLKGHKVGVAFGTGAERFLLAEIAKAGLKREDFDLINLGPPQDSEIIRAGTADAWGGFDAIVTWDTSLALIENAGKTRTIALDMIPMYISMNKSLLNKGDIAKSYLCAVREAWFYYSKHRAELDQLYIKDTNIQVDAATLARISDFVPNAKADSFERVNIALNDDYIADLLSAASLMKGQGRVRQDYDVKQSILQPDSIASGTCQ